MISGMMAESANLMDLFLGCSAIPSGCPGQIGDFDFGNLLSLIPQSGEVKSNGVESTAEKPTVDIVPDVLLPGQTAVAIPEELANLLGIQEQALPPELNRHIPEGIQLTKGEIVSGNDADDGIYLSLPLESKSGIEELVLPLDLRTVEEQGDRMVLEVEVPVKEKLESSFKETNRQIIPARISGPTVATEEEGKLRLKLELVGFQNGTQPQTQNSRMASASDNIRQMPRLLSELGARMIVIECADTPEVTAPATVATAPTADMAATVATVSETNVDLVPFRQVVQWQQPKSTDDAQVQPKVVAEDITPFPATEKATADLAVEDREIVHKFSKGETSAPQTSVEKSESTFTRQENSVTAISDVGDDGKTTGSVKVEADTTTSSVKFSNLDYKLNQLKYNPGQKIEIQLNPPKLGKMDVSISTFRGQVTVNLTVESAAAGKAVEQNLSHLENKMMASGIKVDAFQVNVHSQEKPINFAQAQNPAYQQGGFYQQYQQNRRDNRQSDYPGRQQQQYQQEDISFDRVMVNCLA